MTCFTHSRKASNMAWYISPSYVSTIFLMVSKCAVIRWSVQYVSNSDERSSRKYVRSHMTWPYVLKRTWHCTVYKQALGTDATGRDGTYLHHCHVSWMLPLFWFRTYVQLVHVMHWRFGFSESQPSHILIQPSNNISKQLYRSRAVNNCHATNFDCIRQIRMPYNHPVGSKVDDQSLSNGVN